MDSAQPQSHDGYSASATTIKFDRPIPLLRGPTPAGPADDASSGPYVLAFDDPCSWAAAYRACESQMIQQCEGGARIGCAVSASNKCKPPWWRDMIGAGVTKLSELKERELCEAQEMEGCMAVAREKCVGFAKRKCVAPFRDARIVVPEKEVAGRLVCLVSMREGWSGWGLVRLLGSGKFGLGATNCKASELLGSDAEYQWFFKQ